MNKNKKQLLVVNLVLMPNKHNLNNFQIIILNFPWKNYKEFYKFQRIFKNFLYFKLNKF